MTIKIGIIGTGGMAKAHAREYQKIKGVRLVACCDINQKRAKDFAAEFNIPKFYTDYNKMLNDETLDGVSNVTIDRVHAEVSIAVLKHKVAILCEKPLATSLNEAKTMLAAVRKAKGVVNMVNFSYRNSCALQAAATFIAKGGIGRIIHVESSYLQCWLPSTVWGDWKKGSTWVWRLSTRHGSAGVLGDIGCHIYDMTTFLCGSIAELYCKLKTFDKGVPNNKLGEYVLDANDSFVSNVVFKNGAIGTIHSSRWATGHQNSLRVRVYGDKGAVEVDLDRSYDEYRVVTGKDVDTATWKTIKCKPTPNNYQRFITAIKTGRNGVPDFETGVKIQSYLDGSFTSDKNCKPIKIKN